MDEDYRRRTTEEVARLLTHWREIEFWIKRAEQISKKAVIPAINELRYASRQLFNAFRVLQKTQLSTGDKSVINKRLVITEQYLLNAEHDICDAIIVFYDKIIDGLDTEFGPTAITLLFHEYPLLKERVKESQRLIADSRQDYDKRGENYRALRENHFPQLIAANQRLIDAEVYASGEGRLADEARL